MTLRKITISTSRQDGTDVQGYSVLVDGVPAAATTTDRAKAIAILQQTVGRATRDGRFGPFEVVAWDGDAGVEVPFVQSRFVA